MSFTLFRAGAFIAVLLLFIHMSTNAQTSATLNERQQAMVSIAAYMAKGDLANLNPALAKGLDAGLTVNEEKEVLVQLYAYCGFPRSIHGINTLMKVLDERKTKGIQDEMGKEASPITSTTPKYERGKQNLETLTKNPEVGPKTGFNAFSPVIDVFLKEHLFADIFDRDVLSYQDRELATVSALLSLGGVVPMLQSHLGMSLNTGLTEAQLQQLITQNEAIVGKQEADAARTLLANVVAAKK